jgi:hypothetical protein
MHNCEHVAKVGLYHALQLGMRTLPLLFTGASDKRRPFVIPRFALSKPEMTMRSLDCQIAETAS